MDNKIQVPPQFRHSPLGGKYNGLTIIFSYPSRFDKTHLGSAKAGEFMERTLQIKGYTRLKCDIQQVNNFKGFLPGTKACIIFGEYALRKFSVDKRANLLQHRGYPLAHKSIWCIPTFAPQECMDMRRQYEEEKNPHYIDSDGFDFKDDARSKKGSTARSNYRFWFQRDVLKAISILENEGKLPHRSKARIVVNPSNLAVIKALSNTVDQTLYLDLETDSNLNITCFGFSFDTRPIAVVSLISYDYRPNPMYGRIFYALCLAMSRNTVVCHNGTAFDWLLMAWKYKAPIGPKLYDTMLAQHRCFPEIEKSLGHCVSLWTYEPYHKDDAVFEPRNTLQQTQLMEYCGKDVNTMRMVKVAIDEYAEGVKGLTESIAQVSESIRPYMIISLFGMKFDEGLKSEIVTTNDRLMMHILRLLKTLIGYEMIPTSNVQCIKYFHTALGYKVLKRSEKTGAPSLAADVMYKLKLLYPLNKVIDLCLVYRSLKRDTGALNCKPWSVE